MTPTILRCCDAPLFAVAKSFDADDDLELSGCALVVERTPAQLVAGRTAATRLAGMTMPVTFPRTRTLVAAQAH